MAAKWRDYVQCTMFYAITSAKFNLFILDVFKCPLVLIPRCTELQQTAKALNECILFGRFVLTLTRKFQCCVIMLRLMQIRCSVLKLIYFTAESTTLKYKLESNKTAHAARLLITSAAETSYYVRSSQVLSIIKIQTNVRKELRERH